MVSIDMKHVFSAIAQKIEGHKGERREELDDRWLSIRMSMRPQGDREAIVTDLLLLPQAGDYAVLVFLFEVANTHVPIGTCDEVEFVFGGSGKGLAQTSHRFPGQRFPVATDDLPRVARAFRDGNPEGLPSEKIRRAANALAEQILTA